MNKRLAMHLCPACSGSVIHPDSHGPEDDLADIRKRDAAYDGDRMGLYGLDDRPLNNGNLDGRMQTAADRRMLLRMLDAELAGDKAALPDGEVITDANGDELERGAGDKAEAPLHE